MATNDIKKQINTITHRIQNNKLSTISNQTPTALLQCVVFYSTPVIDNISAKFNLFSNKLRKQLETQKFVFPYYSKEVFVDQPSAVAYLPYFVKSLIDGGKLPKDSDYEKMQEDGTLKCGVVPLVLTIIDQQGDAEEMINNDINKLKGIL